MKKLIAILTLSSIIAVANASDIVADVADHSFDCGYYDDFYTMFDDETTLDTSALLVTVGSTQTEINGYNWPYGWEAASSDFHNIGTASEALEADGFDWPYGI